ncbi:hypothetical protein [Alteromonas gracilis]|uniref:hypothetical protein n=1 Tax=Alteromonas gracilis TaxID=1479524 RepID=UPI00373653F1
MASTKTGLLSIILIGVLLTVAGATYVYHATSIFDEVEKVNKEDAVTQFRRVVMLARAQWIKTKKQTVLLYETEFDATGRLKQQKDVAAELYMNSKGWPEGLVRGQGNGCEYLLTLATLREFDAFSVVTVSNYYANGYLQCAFFIENQMWFEYNAGSGVVRQKIG